ncbi:hypothetical protein GQ54DRAFT_177905 [Martensiomyces pterosporus]|nr:hypothetical protein GQ54DRAFT_177905 [Martensiomyces pterosporus]
MLSLMYLNGILSEFFRRRPKPRGDLAGSRALVSFADDVVCSEFDLATAAVSAITAPPESALLRVAPAVAALFLIWLGRSSADIAVCGAAALAAGAVGVWVLVLGRGSVTATSVTADCIESVHSSLCWRRLGLGLGMAVAKRRQMLIMCAMTMVLLKEEGGEMWSRKSRNYIERKRGCGCGDGGGAWVMLYEISKKDSGQS